MIAWQCICVLRQVETNSFSHSPGRFFAANTLKLMLAYLVLNFDMQPFPADKQPEYIEFGGVSLLLENTTVKMRRRAEEEASDVA